MIFWLKLALVGALVGGLAYAGIEVRNAFVERAQLTADVKALESAVAEKNDELRAAEDAVNDARREAKEQIEKIQGEVTLANQLAEAAVKKNQIIARDLAHAKAAVETWKLSSAAAAAAASLPFPTGVLEPPTTGPTTQIERDPCPTAGLPDGAGAGACVPNLGEGLRLCTAMQGALRTCNVQLEQLRTWSQASH